MHPSWFVLEHKPEGGATVDVLWLLLLVVDATDDEVELGGACVVVAVVVCWLVVPWVVC